MKVNLRNLSGLAATSLANDDCSSVSLNQVENSCAVFIHGKPLSLLFHTSIPESRRGRGRGSGGEEEDSAFFVIDNARLLGPGLPELRHFCSLAFASLLYSFLEALSEFKAQAVVRERSMQLEGKGARSGYGPSWVGAGHESKAGPVLSSNPATSPRDFLFSFGGYNLSS